MLDIKRLIEINIEKHGGKTAFWVKNHDGKGVSAITYNEAYCDISALGTSLIRRGLNGGRIAIVGGNSYDWAVSYLAVLCSGGAAVPLDKEFCIPEFKYYLNVTGCSCAIFSGELRSAFWQIGNDGTTGIGSFINMNEKSEGWDNFSLNELIAEGREMISAGVRDFYSVEIIKNAPGGILLTSGTTAPSKCVELSHGSIASEISKVSKALDITPDDIFFSRRPFHCAQECICGILLPLCCGASIACCEETGYNYDVSVLQNYNLTECASIAAVKPDDEPGFRLLPEMKAKTDRPDPETGVGEICLAGENIMTGYCGEPSAGAASLKDGWLFTGDTGWIDDDGRIHITGRKNTEITNARGEKTSPEELEGLLSGIPYILDSLVWGENSDDGDPIIVATVFFDKEKIKGNLGGDFKTRELERLLWGEIEKINCKLPPYKHIKKILLRIGDFQRTPSQKIYRWHPENMLANF